MVADSRAPARRDGAPRTPRAGPGSRTGQDRSGQGQAQSAAQTWHASGSVTCSSGIQARRPALVNCLLLQFLRTRSSMSRVVIAQLAAAGVRVTGAGPG